MKPTLLLLHGALGHPGDFGPFTSFLNQHFDIHPIALLGHGQAELPESGISISALVEQLRQHQEDNYIKQSHIFGYSLGGYVGLAYALRYPEKVRSILTLATKLSWTEEVAKREVKMLDPQTIMEKVPHFAKQLAQVHGDSKWEALLQQIAKMMLDLGKNPVLNEENLSALSIPVQLMVGDRDKMVSLEETSSAIKHIPNGSFAVLPNTPHPFHKVRNDLLISMMKDFWRDAG